jgi:RHS repeat-associated protein
MTGYLIRRFFILFAFVGALFMLIPASVNAQYEGDIDQDGTVDISDVILVLRCALELDECGLCADIDNDGDVDISDVILTLRVALGLDLIQDCNDVCPSDPYKSDPGICGCGVADIDSDGDGVADCIDQCPDTPFGEAADENGCSSSQVILPPDPATIAPAVDPTVATNIFVSTEFLYTGPDPIQTGVAPGTMDYKRTAILRGRVLNRDNTPLPGVTITILDHPEFGQTLSREDGMFDMAVNGGGALTVDYRKAGYLTSQRQAEVPWQDYVWLPDVVMIAPDTQVTTIDLTSPAPMQVAQGSVVTDNSGTRQAALFIPEGVNAEMVMPDGSTQPITTLNIRATEYTVGQNGPQAMPAELPPTSAYTYAVEYTVDEAEAAGAVRVMFDQPVFSYVDNFLDYPTGTGIPTGYYDREQGNWMPIDNGIVIEILSISDGMADLDIDGDGLADSGTALSDIGLFDAELTELAGLYFPGKSLWRVPITHFTPWDKNMATKCDETLGPCEVPDQKRPKDTDNDKTCKKVSSIISCQNQSLGERVDITATPFSLVYQSDRTPGSPGYSRKISITGDSISAALKKIYLVIEVAGRRFNDGFSPSPNLETTFTWDGKDAYGRTLQGKQPMKVSIGYAYGLTPGTTDRFGYNFDGKITVSGPFASPNFVIWQKFDEFIGGWDARGQGLGGWTLNEHHAYDASSRTLYMGNGEKRSTGSLSGIISTVAWGNGVSDVAAAPDGSIYFTERNLSRISRLDPDGNVTVVAGIDGGPYNFPGYSGDGGPAVNAHLNRPSSVAVGPDGSLYIGDTGNNVVRKVDTNGIITTVAGNGNWGYTGDGGPAVNAQFDEIRDVAASPDGSLYIIDRNHRVRRVDPSGIISTFAGHGFCGVWDPMGDGGPATEACFDYSGFSLGGEIAVGPDGSLYIADIAHTRVRRVDQQGIINTVAGNGAQLVELYGDGGPAVDAAIGYVYGLAVGPDGSLYIGTDPWIGGTGINYPDDRVLMVNSEGIISTLAGNGTNVGGGDGGPARQAQLFYTYGLSLGPDNNLYIADDNSYRIRRVGTVLPGLSLGDILLPAEDSSEVYHFDAYGRHLYTLNALTGAVLYEFIYDNNGLLVQVIDGDNNTTTIQRDVNGNPLAIVGPFSQSTALTVNTEKYLTSIVNPASEAFRFTYYPDGLLKTFEDPKTNTSLFTYDSSGRLIRDEDPAGGYIDLARTDIADGYQVTMTNALNRTTAYAVESLSTGDQQLTVTFPDGTRNQVVDRTDGSHDLSMSDGTTITYLNAPDPRWNMLSPVISSMTTSTPGGLSSSSTHTRAVNLSDPDDLLSLINVTENTSVNGRTYTGVYDAATRRFTDTSPEGRQRKTTIDILGRIVQEQIPGLFSLDYTYDEKGRLAAATEGTGTEARSMSLTYNSKGYLDTITDPLTREVSFTYDNAGRITEETLPDGEVVQYGYDANGNVTSIIPPGRPAHTFSYNLVDLVASYVPPDVGVGTNQTLYEYNKDEQLTRTTRPDGKIIDSGYDSAGRLSTLTIPRGQFVYAYDPTRGQLTSITAPDSGLLSYSYDGFILTGQSWTGVVAGSVVYSYDHDFRTTSISVNSSSAIAYLYDNDGLLTQAGDMVFTSDPQNGLLTGAALGNVTETFSYSSFGELQQYNAAYNGANFYSVEFTYDKLGRIKTNTETVEGATDIYEYVYDLAGQLEEVKKNSAIVATYSYDSNGNRLSYSGGGSTVSGSYDDQDRLLQYGSEEYDYTANGELLTMTEGTQIKTYDYDVLGNLIAVTLPDGTQVEYLIDGQGRRIGKKVNSTLVQGFLYQDQLNPIAELDGLGNVVSRFIYGARGNVPAYMIKGGNAYRIVSDHLGSPRIVINTDTGEIVQRIDYDEFGNVVLDRNPGFQPFGFASGIYDQDANLVRFGARDYEAKTGRWTAKDPILFAAGDSNLYAYVMNDPVNWTDQQGMWPHDPPVPMKPVEPLTKDEHLNRNRNNYCPTKKPEIGTADCTGRVWRTYGSKKYRADDGSECAYDKNGNLLNWGTFNYGSFPISRRHLWNDVVPHDKDNNYTSLSNTYNCSDPCSHKSFNDIRGKI